MSSILKVDTIQDQSGNNIINENADTITIGASGDTISIPSGATIDASGATLTLPTTIEVDAIEPQSGTSLTLGASGDTITIPSGATITNSGTATGFGESNTPAFLAKLSSAQTVSFGTDTKLQADSEVFDTDNCYDNTTNYRFTPTTAGKYYVYCNIVGRVGADDNWKTTQMDLYKNGSRIWRVVGTGLYDQVGNLGQAYISTVVDMNGSSDYLEVYGFILGTAGTPEFSAGTNGGESYFGAYLLTT